MMEFMDKKDILELKQQGVSNREAARWLGVNRKTVAKYWNEYKLEMAQLNEKDTDTRAIQEEPYKKPKYQTSGRRARKYTQELEERLREILAEERRKDTILGPGHKQKLTNSRSTKSWCMRALTSAAPRSTSSWQKSATKRRRFTSDFNTTSATDWSTISERFVWIAEKV
jgi:transposase